MGQVIRRLQEYGIRPQDFMGIPLTDTSPRGWDDNCVKGKGSNKDMDSSDYPRDGFSDLSQLPPELGVEILRYLNATDLCLASCVWSHIANDEILWRGLCHNYWGYVSIYNRHPPVIPYKQIFMILDEASLSFNTDPSLGFEILVSKEILDDAPMDVARFLHSTSRLWPNKKLEFLQQRPDVLERLVQLQNFENQFLPNALRKFFRSVSAPKKTGNMLSLMIENFSERFCSCNPTIGLSKDAVFVLCYSLIMLSVDLGSPQVKNKMSKREFIKNTCRAVTELSTDLAGHMYDNIYLAGHVAPKNLME